MKNTFVAMLVLLSVSSYAGTTDTLILQGEVASILDIVVNENGTTNSSLDLSASPVSPGTIVASVHEMSNSPSGYEVSISSANASVLKHTNGVDEVAYSITYGGAAVTMGTPIAVAYTSGLMEADKDVGVIYTGSSSLAAGIYSDTLTFTIAAQ